MKKIFKIVSYLLVGVSYCVADVVIVANKSSGITSISRNELVSLYSGRGKKVAGKSVKPIMLKSGPSHEAFCKKYLNRSPSSLSKIWKKLVFTGKASMLKTLNNENEIIRSILSSNELVGYINKDNLTDELVVVEVR